MRCFDSEVGCKTLLIIGVSVAYINKALMVGVVYGSELLLGLGDGWVTWFCGSGVHGLPLGCTARVCVCTRNALCAGHVCHMRKYPSGVSLSPESEPRRCVNSATQENEFRSKAHACSDPGSLNTHWWKRGACSCSSCRSWKCFILTMYHGGGDLATEKAMHAQKGKKQPHYMLLLDRSECHQELHHEKRLSQHPDLSSFCHSRNGPCICAPQWLVFYTILHLAFFDYLF